MQTASEDIVCYKVIQIYHRPDGDDYRTYFQHVHLTLGEPITASTDDNNVQTLTNLRFLYGEVVHAFCDISCDDSDIDWYIEDTRDCPCFSEYDVSIAKVECIIPKGTLFCEGFDDCNIPCYGAKVIIPKKVIETIKTIHRDE